MNLIIRLYLIPILISFNNMIIIVRSWLLLKIVNTERVYLGDYRGHPFLERLIYQLKLQIVWEKCCVDVEPESSWGQFILYSQKIECQYCDYYEENIT